MKNRGRGLNLQKIIKFNNLSKFYKNYKKLILRKIFKLLKKYKKEKNKIIIIYKQKTKILN